MVTIPTVTHAKIFKQLGNIQKEKSLFKNYAN